MSTPPSHIDELVGRAAALVGEARSILICAGAGMGVDSGLPDFRGTQGFWRAYPALKRQGITFEQISSAASFEQDRALCWGFDGHRLGLYRKTIPHRGFHILSTWGSTKPGGIAVSTSNVDGQFQKAGFDPRLIHEIHGSLHALQCSGPCSRGIWSADSFRPEVHEPTGRLANEAPTCPLCARLAIPNVKMFGDKSWIFEPYEEQAARLSEWMRRAGNPVVIEIGAGTSIPTIRRKAEKLAGAFGSGLVRINPREYDLPDALGVGIPLGAAAALEAIDSALRSRARPASSKFPNPNIAD